MGDDRQLEYETTGAGLAYSRGRLAELLARELDRCGFGQLDDQTWVVMAVSSRIDPDEAHWSRTCLAARKALTDDESDPKAIARQMVEGAGHLSALGVCDLLVVLLTELSPPRPCPGGRWWLEGVTGVVERVQLVEASGTTRSDA